MDLDKKEIDEEVIQANGDVANLVSSTSNHLNKVGDISVDQRVKRKAKRLLRQHSSQSQATTSGGACVAQVKRYWKNSRKPRKGFGLSKKGAGSKGVWAKLDADDYVDDLDHNDPNYDSDTLDNGNIELASAIPELSEEELRKNVELIILEYFEHGDTEEAITSIDELNCISKRYLILAQIIEVALDHKPSHREMSSVLIAELVANDIIRPKFLVEAFESLLANLPDLTLDTPDASSALGNFMARAVADACISRKVVEALKAKSINDLALNALHKAETLLSSEHGLYRLDNVWGIGGGLRPVKTLIRQMNLLLEEFVSSGDVNEAIRCINELEVPHFHHELVYEAVLMTFETLNSEVEQSMCTLLKALSNAVIISPDMMRRGFLRVYEDLPDILIDVPLAYTILERFLEQCYKAGFVTDDIISKMPMRGRKRFVSEGDGGRVKQSY